MANTLFTSVYRLWPKTFHASLHFTLDLVPHHLETASEPCLNFANKHDIIPCFQLSTNMKHLGGLIEPWFSTNNFNKFIKFHWNGSTHIDVINHLVILSGQQNTPATPVAESWTSQLRCQSSPFADPRWWKHQVVEVHVVCTNTACLVCSSKSQLESMLYVCWLYICCELEPRSK